MTTDRDQGFRSTHLITFTPDEGGREYQWRVMLTDTGKAYTQYEWEGEDNSDLSRINGQWLWKGASDFGGFAGTFTAEEITVAVLRNYLMDLRAQQAPWVMIEEVEQDLEVRED